VINPLTVEGQLHGEWCRIGQALMEMTVYDTDGQLLTRSSWTTRCRALPMRQQLASSIIRCRRTTNVLERKGCGEAGCAARSLR